MFKKIIIYPFLLFFIISPSLAETVYLKDGKTVEGKIIEKTDKYIKVEVSGVPVTFFNDQLQEDKGKSIDTEIDIPDKDKQGWYVNNEFMLRIKNILGWELKESKDIQNGVSMLSLAFMKPSSAANFRNSLIINVSKINTPDKPVKKGDEFIAYADSAIDSATKNFDKRNFDKRTISINNVGVREATFEWFDKNINQNVISKLMFFEPVEISSGIVSVFILFKSNLEDYSSFQSDISTSLNSIQVGK